MTTAAGEPDDRADVELGGETVCWAHLVCPECGRMATSAQPEACEACGADLPD